MHGRTRADEETLVKSSNDCKLALHIGCDPNTKEYPCCCLPIISLLCMSRHWHMHMHVYNHLRESHTSSQLGLNLLQPTSECGLASTRVQLGFIEREFSADTCNPSWTRVQPKLNSSSTRVQVAVQTCLKYLCSGATFQDGGYSHTKNLLQPGD